VHQPLTLQAAAEAVTDGSDPDWDAAEATPDTRERRLIGHLRVIAGIGRARATLYSTGVAAAAAEQPSDLPPGATWGSLRILEKVAQGRFGDVYRAWDPALDREVALKILRRRDRHTVDDARVIDEGRLMARVRHPNVVTIFGAQRIDGRTGLWMEFVEGQTLEAELAERGPADAPSLAQIGIDVCAALDAVHAAGLVHRDVKAQNVLRERGGRIVLGDFGTGRELDDSDSGSRAQPQLAGTPVYLAPEIFARQPATAQSDLYSLGVLLFHLATRDYPVKGQTLGALRVAHEGRQITSLRSARPDLPTALTAAIDRALEFEPAQRFGSARELSDALSRWLHRSRRSARWGLAAAAVLVLVAMAGVAWWRMAAEPTPLALSARDWVLVTAAINRTGNSVLDGTIEYALQRELSRSPVVNVAPRARVADVLQLMRKPPNTPVDLETGREVALRDGAIRALVTGRVDKVGDAYGLSVDITDPSEGVLLASLAEPPVPADELLKAIGRVAIAVRRRLGEGFQTTEASRLQLAKVTTPSLRALQLFSQVSTLLDGQGGMLHHTAAAEQLARAAIAEDPNFAMGHLQLSETIRIQGRLAEAFEHLQHALTLADQVSDVERLAIEGALAMQGELTSDPKEQQRWREHGIAKQEAILQLIPNNYSSLVILTNLYAQLGRPHLAYATRLSDLRPHGYEWAARAVTAALWAGDIETARRYAARGAAAPVPVPPRGNRALAPAWMWLFGGLEAWLGNDVVRALSAADEVAAGFDTLPPTTRSVFAAQLSYFYLMLGRLNAAQSFAARIEDPLERRILLLRVAIARADPARIWDVIVREYPRAEDAASVGSALVMSGRLREARQAVALLQKRPDAGGTFAGFVEGQIALAEGRVDEAVTSIERHFSRFQPGGAFLIAETMASALAARGDHARGIAILESFSPPRARLVANPGPLAHEWLSMRDLLARLYRDVGRHPEADARDAELRALIAVADDDHPIKRRLQ
jgi:tRNA A-37 threonylcarbamoyl transferase component Bud32/tetratricopeptide (TPR) repeat protein